MVAPIAGAAGSAGAGAAGGPLAGLSGLFQGMSSGGMSQKELGGGLLGLLLATAMGKRDAEANRMNAKQSANTNLWSSYTGKNADYVQPFVDYNRPLQGVSMGVSQAQKMGKDADYSDIVQFDHVSDSDKGAMLSDSQRTFTPKMTKEGPTRQSVYESSPNYYDPNQFQFKYW